jgi:hypothetical protein
MPVGELISVLVPRPLLADVYDLVVQHERELAGEDDDSEPLSEGLVRRMYDESEPQHRKLMKLLASSAGEWLYTSEIAEELALPHGSRSAAGMFGAFGRRAAHRYDGVKPWTSEWDAAAGETRHMMSAEVAEIVNSL